VKEISDRPIPYCKRHGKCQSRPSASASEVYLKAHYSSEMLQFSFLKKHFIIDILLQFPKKITICHKDELHFAYFTLLGTTIIVNEYFVWKSILFCLHFATFTTHNCTFSATFFSCLISNILKIHH
jgi:hypothetical protein